MAVAEQVVIDLIARTDKLEAGLNRAGKSMDGIATQARALGPLLAGFLGVQTAQKLLAFAETAKQVEAQLRLATATFGDFNKAQEDTARIAASTRSGIAETTSLYGNFLRAAQQTGKSQEDAATATESFARALKIGGADANAAASATLQFGQALASGALRGDEFNSIAEASPRILRLLADSLGVPQGAVRALAEEGKLTSDVLFRALTERKFTAGLEAEFKSLPQTTGDALSQLENAAIAVFGKFDKGGQFSTALANFITSGADGFADLEKDATEFGIEVGAALAGLGAAFDPFRDGGSSAIDFLRGKFLGLRAEISQVLGAIDTIRNAGRGKGLIDTDTFNNTRIGGVKIGDFRGGVFRLPGLSPASDSKGAFDRAGATFEAQARDRTRAAEINDRFGFDPKTLTFKPPSAPIRSAATIGKKSGPKGKSDAEKAADKAAREAAAANRELEQSLNALQAAYDPVAVASDRYAQNVKAIDALTASGKLSDGDAFVYRFRAAAELAEATRKATEETIGLMDRINPFEGAESDLRTTIDGADRGREAGLTSASGQDSPIMTEEQYQTQRDKIQGLADTFTEAFSAGSGDIFENFKKQGLRALAVLIARFAVLQATQGNGGIGNIVKNISGAFNQSGGLSGLFGRASGGYVGAGQMVRVNEGASPGNVEGWRPQGSGTVIPLGRMKAARAGGGTTVLQTIAVDARGAVMNDQFARDILARADGNARAVSAATATGQRKALPAASARLSQLGTTG